METKWNKNLITSDRNSPELRLPLDGDSSANLSPAKPQTSNPKATIKPFPAPFASASAYTTGQLDSKSQPTKQELSLVDRMLQDLEVGSR